MCWKRAAYSSLYKKDASRFFERVLRVVVIESTTFVEIEDHATAMRPKLNIISAYKNLLH